MMITVADVEGLLGIGSAGPSVLSLYVRVPLDPPALRGLPARVEELIASARRGPVEDHDVAAGQDEDRHIARRLLEIHAREWLGHTVAIFACGDPQLAKTFVLPGALGERAVFASRPHVRPLLLALQRFPGYCVVIVDQPHAWVFRVTGDRIDRMTLTAAAGLPSTGFGGWYGLESHRVNEHVIQLARHRYRDTAAALGPITQTGGTVPLVIGGQSQDIPQFLAELTDDVRNRVVGTFAVDPRTITPSTVRDLSGQVIARWAGARERRLVTEAVREPRGGLAATGLQACLDAVNQRAAKLVVVPETDVIPGFVCRRCGMLSTTGTDCQDWGAASVPVADLIEEIVLAAIRDGAQVEATPDPPGGIAARLRFPLAARNAQSA